MKYIVTHTSPDWDAIGSVWIIKKYLAGWQEAEVKYVPAGQRVSNSKYRISIGERLHQVTDEAIETIGDDEYMHVDTGLGPLDHHQTYDQDVCGASKCWEYIKKSQISHPKGTSFSEAANLKSQKSNLVSQISKEETVGFTMEHIEAVDRIMKILVDVDHFQEIFWGGPVEDYQEFSLNGVLDGLKLEKPNQDSFYMEFGRTCLDALLHGFENRIEAEKTIKETGVEFESRWGKSIGFETLNDTVIKLSQKMGYNLVLRKDPRKGYVRIKLRPEKKGNGKSETENNDDLTLAYEKLQKIDPEATWYLHVSKKMLLNGTPKNPTMVPTKLSLEKLIDVLKEI